MVKVADKTSDKEYLENILTEKNITANANIGQKKSYISVDETKSWTYTNNKNGK